MKYQYSLDISALLSAITNRDKDVVLQLLQNGANANESDVLQSTPLSCAARTGDVALCQLLLDYGAKVDSNLGFSPLVSAVFSRSVAVLELLLTHGATVDLQLTFGDYAGQTALMVASQIGDRRMIALLLERGSSLTLRDSHGHTAADHASCHVKEIIAMFPSLREPM